MISIILAGNRNDRFLLSICFNVKHIKYRPKFCLFIYIIPLLNGKSLREPVNGKHRMRNTKHIYNCRFFGSWLRDYKTFFVLNSFEHEFLNAHKYKYIKKFSLFKARVSGEGSLFRFFGDFRCGALLFMVILII